MSQHPQHPRLEMSARRSRRVRTYRALLGAACLTLAGPVALAAQERRGSIPAGHLPPPGECRVWYDDRPAGQQPPPTSCETARREAYRSGGRVVYGGGEGRDERRRDRDGDQNRERDRDRRECDEKDRAKGECGAYPDVRYPERRDPDRRYPDRDRDGRDSDRYPDDRRYPSSLPDMVWGVVFGRGQRLDEVRQWVGPNDVRVQYTDADRNGTPEAVTWLDGAERIVQRWYDDDRDGRADRVAVYRNNRVVRVIQ